MTLLIETDNKIFDITDLVTDLSWTDSLNNGASVLEFTYLNTEVMITNGAPVRLTDDDGNGVFFGHVFKVNVDDKKKIKVKAYDSLRYCKAKDTIAVAGETVSDLVKKMCAFFSFEHGGVAETGYQLKAKIHTDKTWLDIIYDGISDTLIGTQHYYTLRDEFGSIALRDLEDLQTGLVLGDDSLANGFSYEKSIDGDFYNQVKLVKENEQTGKADVYMVYDSDSIGKYGLLQYYEKLNKDATGEKEKADALLRLYNREAEKLSFKCVGDMRFRAGISVYASVSDLAINRRVVVSKVTHKFLPVHTMDVEVMAS